MRGGGAGRLINAPTCLKDFDLQSLTGECQRGDKSHWTAAGDENWACRSEPHGRCQRGAYCLMPAVATASAHSGMSAAIMAANSRGLLPMGSAPYLARRSMTFGSLRARMTSVANVSMRAVGVPAGAMRPFHAVMVRFGKPDSPSVGTCEICGIRLLPDTASMRTAPLDACAIASDTAAKQAGT